MDCEQPNDSSTDSYRNNMNDLDLIYFTEDEIYVRLPTVYMLLGYLLKNPRSFKFLS